MDKSIAQMPIVRETRFRTPGRFERECALWVDRIGSATQTGNFPARLRVFGQYAAIEIEHGNGRFITAEGGQWDVGAGDVILLTPRQPAAYGPTRSWYTRWVVWNGPEAERLSLMLDAERLPLLRSGADAVRRAFFALAPVIGAEDLAAALERKGIVLRMVASLIRVRTSRRASGAQEQVEMAVDYIRERLSEPLTIGQLARMCSLSEPHFRRLFRRHTGCSPIEFITAQRVAKAKELLVRGLPIKSVAAEIGLSDSLYFMRLFKKVTGETAGRFVAEHRSSV